MSIKRAKRTSATEAKRVPITTKLLPALRDNLLVEAERNHRTLSSEIEHRLAQSFEAQPDTRTIIREELARAEEQKREALMARVKIGPNGSLSAMNESHGRQNASNWVV